MTILTTTLIVLNIIFAVLMLYCMRNLRWRDEPDRAALIGFAVLAVTLVGDAVVLGVM